MTLPAYDITVLPEIPLRDGYRGRRRDSREFFPVDRGTPKVHRGQTHRQWEQEVSFLLTDQQFDFFENWYEVDLGGGTSWFTYRDARRGETGVWMFDEGAYDFRESGALAPDDKPQWVVSFKLIRIN